MRALPREIRHAVRGLRRRPGFAVTAIVTVALCVGANAAVFSVVRSVLYRPLPLPEPERLVRLFNSYPHGGAERSGNSVPDLDDRQRLESFEAVALYTRTSHVLEAGGVSRRVPTLAVTRSFFSALGVAPLVGRAFIPASDASGERLEVVSSHDFWQTSLGGSDDVIGRTMRLEGEDFTVVGVLPEGFRFSPGDAELFTTLSFTPRQRSDAHRHRDWYSMIGRLAPGVTVESAQAELDALNRTLLSSYPGTLRREMESAGYGTVVRPFLDDLVRGVRRPLSMLWIGVLIVVAIGATNLASLYLVRARSRAREIASRVALGAGPARVLRQLAVESFLVSALGGCLGFLLAVWSLKAVGSLDVFGIPRLDDVRADRVVFAVSAALTGALGLVATAAAATPLGRRPDLGLLQGSRGGTDRGASKMQRSLVTVQIALAFVLATSAGLLVESVRHLGDVDPGFDGERVAAVALELPDDRYPDEVARLGFTGRVLEALGSLPALRGVALADQLPFTGGGAARVPVVGERSDAGGGEAFRTPFQTIVSPGYFAALGVEVAAGRGFRSADDATSQRVAVVDERLAARLWPGQDPLGRHLWRGETEGRAPDPAKALVVVGVVEPIQQNSLIEPTPAGALYLPIGQHPLGSFHLVLRHDGDPDAVWPAARSRIAFLDPALALVSASSLGEGVAASIAPRRVAMAMLSVAAFLGLFLGALGVHGVMAYAVGARAREIGIRMAVGSTRRRIASLLARDGLAMVVVGMALGFLGVEAAAAGFRSLLYQTGTLDPLVLAGAASVIVGGAAVACLHPVWRAVRIDPVEVLERR